MEYTNWYCWDEPNKRWRLMFTDGYPHEYIEWGYIVRLGKP